jgi:hypothetical protein
MVASYSAIDKFISSVNASRDLHKQVQKALEGSTSPKTFVELGAKHGYTFTEAEAQSYFADLFNAPSSESATSGTGQHFAGSKDVPNPLEGRQERLKQAVTLLRPTAFKGTPPHWTGFDF